MPAKGSSGGCWCNKCFNKPLRVATLLEGYPVPWGFENFCCSCIPLAICVTIGDYENEQTITAWLHCSAQPDFDTPFKQTMYSVTTLFGDETITLYFQFSVDPDYGTCEFCVTMDGETESCILIDHDELHDDEYCTNPCDMRTAFCCDFAATFELGGLTISTRKLDLLARPKCGTGCQGCDCICRCACLTISSALGNFQGVVCAEEDYDGNLTWSTGDFSVTMLGRTPTYVEYFQIDPGTVNSGSEDSILQLDSEFHEIVPSGGQIDVNYLIHTGVRDGEDFTDEITWYGYVNGDGAIVEILLWNWETEQWVKECEITGRDDNVIRMKILDLSFHPEYTGSSGLDTGRVKIRLRSDNATLIATDFMHFRAPNCCKLYLTLPAGLSSGEVGPVLLTGTNTCPDPVASWSTTGDSGSAFVRWECVDCRGQCPNIGGGGTECCPGGVPSVLNVTITDSSCPEFIGLSYQLIFKSAAEGGDNCWEVEGLGSPFPGSWIKVCCDQSSWTLTSDACNATLGVTYGASCDPLVVAFGITTPLLGCCPSRPFDSFVTWTWEVTL